MASWYVYYLNDPVTGELLYIGRSFNVKQRRWSFERRTGIKAVISPAKQRFTDLDEACAAELKAIARHRPPHNQRLVSNKGTVGMVHGPMSKQHRLAISAGITGQKRGPLSPETKAKLSAIRKGRKVSAETRIKLSNAAHKQWQRVHHHQENENA